MKAWRWFLGAGLLLACCWPEWPYGYRTTWRGRIAHEREDEPKWTVFSVSIDAIVLEKLTTFWYLKGSHLYRAKGNR